MWYIYISSVEGTPKPKVDISDKPYVVREGLTLTKTIPFALQKKAVSTLLSLRSEFCRLYS